MQVPATSPYNELTKFCSKDRHKFLNFLRKNVDDSDAQDILHNAFIKATQNLPKFQRKAKPSTWFSAILHNLVCDHYKNKRQSNQLRQEIVHSSSYHPLERYLQEELKCLLQKAINSLPNPNHNEAHRKKYCFYASA